MIHHQNYADYNRGKSIKSVKIDPLLPDAVDSYQTANNIVIFCIVRYIIILNFIRA